MFIRLCFSLHFELQSGNLDFDKSIPIAVSVKVIFIVSMMVLFVTMCQSVFDG